MSTIFRGKKIMRIMSGDRGTWNGDFVVTGDLKEYGF